MRDLTILLQDMATPPVYQPSHVISCDFRRRLLYTLYLRLPSMCLPKVSLSEVRGPLGAWTCLDCDQLHDEQHCTDMQISIL